MAVLFNVIETKKVKSILGLELEVRLLKRGEDDWGVDNTMTMESVFGYNEESARNVYKRIWSSYKGGVINE